MGKKACTHKAQIYNLQKGCLVCQFCGQQVKEFSGTKKSEPIKKVAGVKMGYEQQNPNVLKAEKMKRSFNALTIDIKRELDPVRKEEMKAKQKELKSEMLKLANEMNGN